MSLRTRLDWFSSQIRQRRGLSANRRRAVPFSRRLRVEPLEDRRLLSITVNTLVDENNGVGVGGISLRDAIGAAASGETINFSVTGPINLTFGQLSINKNLSINGPGAGLLTVSAQNNSRVFSIDDGTDGQIKVHLADMRLMGGNAANNDGGGIFSLEDLSLTRMAISGNVAGRDGGGLYVRTDAGATTTIVDSTISGNVAQRGGGIFAQTESGSTLTIVASTISGNSATMSGGGISSLATSASTHVIRHSTIAANSGGAIHAGGTSNLTLDHTIVADGVITGTVHANYCLIESPGGATIVGKGNILNKDPLLASLANNGGPTMTHALLEDSPAFDAGNPDLTPAAEFDQRGPDFHRVFGSAVDIGAYERQTFDSDALVVNSDSDSALRAAIDTANSLPGLDVITFGPSLDGETIELTLGELAIIDSLVIDATNLPNGLTIVAADPTPLETDSGDGSRIFNIDDGDDLTDIDVVIRGLTLTRGDVSENGGAIYSRENLTVANCEISGNATTRRGGGIFHDSIFGSLTVLASTISGNAALLDGGGIYLDTFYGNGKISNSTISGNAVGRDGGGIYAFANTTITSSTISGNAALGDGGGVANRLVSMTIIESTISGNSSGSRGGGIFSYADYLGVLGSMILGNVAHINGGGVHLEVGKITGFTNIANSSISGNAAGQFGGGVYFTRDYNPTAIAHSTITQNAALLAGGGIYAPALLASLSGEGGDDVFLLGMSHTIVAANEKGGDVPSDITGFVLPRYCLIGDKAGTGLGEAPVGSPDSNGNLIGGPMFGTIDPLLEAPADNGGPTLTHTLLPGSPAIDNGDPAIVFNPNEFDQRGYPFTRVSDGDGSGVGQIDIGAYEQHLFVAMVVDTLIDEDDGDYSPGDVSLREAIGLVNRGAADAIYFVGELSGGTITLTMGELPVSASLIIDARGLPNGPTIDASGNDPAPTMDVGGGSRIFNVSDGQFATKIDVAMYGLTLAGGNVSGDGGAIRSDEILTIADSTVVGNSAIANGGGIFGFLGETTVSRSTIAGNQADNGGGIFASGDLTVAASTISRNSAHAGGGIWTLSGLAGPQFALVDVSTVSGNSASNFGGGIFNQGGLAIVRFSTITDNTAPAGAGSGVASFGNASTRTEVKSSIIAGNTNSDVNFVTSGTHSFQSNGYNLIGTGNAVGDFNGPGDQTGVINPLLFDLAFYGGPTMTHRLRPGSLAINTGDPDAMAGVGDVPEFDQRGAPWSRVAVGRIDKGAFEENPLPGDYNFNGIVDAPDYTRWRNTLGSTNDLRADGNDNGVVDSADYGVWKSHFGDTLSGAGGGGVEQGVRHGEFSTGSGELATANLRQGVEEIRGTAEGERGRAELSFALDTVAAISRGRAPAEAGRARRLRLESTAARAERDDALLAWLETQSSSPHVRSGGDSERRADDRPADEADAGLLESVDAAFELG